MTDNTDAVIVSQAARDAALKHLGYESEADLIYWSNTDDIVKYRQLCEAFARFEQATLASQSAELEAVRVDRDRLSDEVCELKTAPWPKWAEDILNMLTSYGMTYEAEDGLDLGEAVSEWLSEFDPADHARAIAAETKLAGAVSELKHYADTFCEGLCEGSYDQARFTEDQCSGCRAARTFISQHGGEK